MKRILGLGLLVLSFSVPALAAKNSQGIAIANDVRVGDTLLRQGDCTFSWTEPSGGSVVQLTLKIDGQKPVTVPAHMVAETHFNPGAGTVQVNGVTYLHEVHTKTTTFVIEGASGAPIGQ
ncbi:hypothetical protein [Granulicella sp. S156]|jgi:hypothetical protein|uniref:hypothetical protein n=1 Tax=Granulicella sp. S156 TaxID=1747224 RepID=UPI00131D9750|nr:hypothetical protein [Granulicella sp. S156]